MKAVLVIKATPGLQQQYLDYLDEYMHNPNPDFHSLRVQPTEYGKPALARELSTKDNEEFESMMRNVKLPLSVNHMGMKVPLHGRFVYPFEAAAFAPQRGGVDTDVPDSYLWDVHSHKPRQLHLYGFEGNTTPQRYAGYDEGRAQPEGIIYGDIDDDLITRFSNKPVTLDNLRYGAMALLPNSILPLQVEDLNEKQAEAAQLLMDAGVPPLLTQGNGLAGHAPFRQWDAAPERSAIPTEELPYATNPGRVITGEPMDIAFQLLKEESEGQLYNEDLFEGLLDEDDHMHYDEMNDKQRAIIDAKAALPSHLFTEGSEMGENMNPYLFSRSMHEKIPEYHYDDELEYLQHFNDAMQPLVNNREKTLEIMDNGDEEHPEHPHNVAMSRMHPDFKNRMNTILRLYKASKPMDIAFQLLKQSLELQPPMTQGVEEEQPIEEIPMVETMDYNNCDCAEKVRNAAIQMGGREDILEWLKSLSCEEIQQESWYEEAAKMYCGGLSEADQMKYAGEPMDIALQLLKERVSPEAKRHKLEYDKKYESTPERVKYREELNRERRRRGIYGSHDHKDISHTEGGKLTLEGEHENRARHFKDKGTLREL